MNLTRIEDLKQDYKYLLKEVSLKGRMESFLEDLNMNDIPMTSLIEVGQPRSTGLFHASMLGDDAGREGKFAVGCGRKLQYSYTEEPSVSNIDAKLRMIFDTGTAIHSQLQMYLGAMAAASDGYYEFTPEASAKPENNIVADKYDLSAHTDGIFVVNGPNKVRFGLEIKSINDNGYRSLKSPVPKHITQATVYQACFDLPVFLFLYYNKNSSSIAEFVHVFEKDRWDAIRTRVNKVRSAVLQNTMMEQDISYQCGTCAYAHVCKPPKKTSKKVAARMFQIRR